MNIEVPQDLAVGQETAQWVLDVIRMNPELHNQASWWGATREESYQSEGFYSCGTTHCVAGWAAFAHMEMVTKEFAHWVNYLEEEALGHLVPEIGALVLGLGKDDAGRLFLQTTDSQAVHALEYLAKGEDIDWAAVNANRYDPQGYDLP